MLGAGCVPIFFKAAFYLWFDWSISGKLGFLFGSRTLKINRTFMFSNSTLWAERHLEEVILLVGGRNLAIFCLQRTQHLVTLLLDPWNGSPEGHVAGSSPLCCASDISASNTKDSCGFWKQSQMWWSGVADFPLSLDFFSGNPIWVLATYS